MAAAERCVDISVLQIDADSSGSRLSWCCSSNVVAVSSTVAGVMHVSLVDIESQQVLLIVFSLLVTELLQQWLPLCCTGPVPGLLPSPQSVWPRPGATSLGASALSQLALLFPLSVSYVSRKLKE